MGWRVALIDSCGGRPGALEAAAFADDGGKVVRCATVPDATGHGSRVAQLLAGVDGGGDGSVELLLGQVFLDARPASAAAVAAAVDWAFGAGADLIHMSLGLAADRAVLAAAVKRASGAGCIVVASTPARGALVYPACYAGVIRATGDARCAPGELSHLGPWLFGGCPRFEVATSGGGASMGAAWVTRSILTGAKRAAGDVVAALTAAARYVGAESRGREAPAPAAQ